MVLYTQFSSQKKKSKVKITYQNVLKLTSLWLFDIKDVSLALLINTNPATLTISMDLLYPFELWYICLTHPLNFTRLLYRKFQPLLVSVSKFGSRPDFFSLMTFMLFN